MKFSSALSIIVSVIGANAAVTLVQPVPTDTPDISGSFSLPTDIDTSFSVTATASVSVGGVDSSDGATTYILQQVVGINGETDTFTQTIVQGATVWRNAELHETCSLDGKGHADCIMGIESVFTTTFTGTAIPIFTVGAAAGGGGGGGGSSGNGNSGGNSSSGNGSGNTGGAASMHGGTVSLAWMFAVSVGAMVAGMRLAF